MSFEDSAYPFEDNAESARDELKLWLIAARKPEAIADLENRAGVTQAQAVNELIEETEWRHRLAVLTGYRGTAEQRLNALRHAIASSGLDGPYAAAMREPN